MALQQPEPDAVTLAEVYKLMLEEHKWLDDQLTAVRNDTAAVRQSVAALPCKQHGDDIAEAKKAAEEIKRSYNLARLVAGIATVIALVITTVSGMATNVATALGIGRTP